MKNAVASTAIALIALASANGAQAQGRGGQGGDAVPTGLGRGPLIQERAPKSPTAESEAWLSKEIQFGDWRLVAKDADGAILAHPAGMVRSDGVVPMHLRIEYRTPLTINHREIRSVQAELQVDCGTQQILGQASGFEGANLTGRKMGLDPLDVAQSGPGAAKVVTLIPFAEGIKLLTNQILADQCAEGHRFLAAKYGPDWRPLLSDESGVRLVAGNEKPNLDLNLAVTFRIEAKAPQADPKLKWRSAIAKMNFNCAAGTLVADTTLYRDPNQTGPSADLAFEALVTPKGLRSRAKGEPVSATDMAPRVVYGTTPGTTIYSWFYRVDTMSDQGPGKSIMGMLRNGLLIGSECVQAKAKLASALATPGDPLRRQAETWAATSLNTKGFRLPTYLPEGVLMLSDEVVATPAGQRRAVIRAEFNRPVPGRDGKAMASRITVIEVDCASKKLRGVSESTFAKNGAKELIREAANPQAAWANADDLPSLGDYVGAVCTTKPAS